MITTICSGLQWYLYQVYLSFFAFEFTGHSLFSVVVVTGMWGIFYDPCFLIGVGHMISAAPNAKEFANSLQTSLGNLDVSLGTAIGGFYIDQNGISITPWGEIAFGVLAVLNVLWRAYLDRIQHKKNDAIEHIV